MELRHLRYFVAVAEEQNVTRAAVRLHVSQPPLSRQIRDLEEELGVGLFEHGAKAVRLTETGRVFLTEAQAVLQRFEEAVQKVKSVAGVELSQIHIGYAPSLAVDLLPQALRIFQQSHPAIQVHLHDLSTQEMLRGLRDGMLQAALNTQTSRAVMTGLSFEPLAYHAACVAMHLAHPLARTKEVSLMQLLDERFVAFTLSEYPEHHAWIAKLFAPFAKRPRIIEEHDSVSSLITAVEAGRGVALVSQRLHCLAESRLKILPLHPAPPPLVVGITCRKGKVPDAMASFIQIIRRISQPSAC